MKAFAKDMIVDKPIPGWFFQLLDELHEVEADVTISNVRLCKFPSSESLEIQSRQFNQLRCPTFGIIRLEIFRITGLLLVIVS
jgi:hypothetical protein